MSTRRWWMERIAIVAILAVVVVAVRLVAS